MRTANRRQRKRPGPPANNRAPDRRIIVNLHPGVPICTVEIEVFDLLIGSFEAFATNDNERPDPNPGEIRGPPMCAD